ncbi:hypothetical protein NQ314_001375 [Rhamnusium bicolor]|uniref:Uncharacterized protein n=1 Tax=Rhamnusium bicolor TaxID=1586634 RepID=A0AAV8ZT18_9CUCU|nr:hypothetical protein NQ314_001375 [Rhamnusium bicolor]
MEKIIQNFPSARILIEEGLMVDQIDNIRVQTEIQSKKGSKGMNNVIYALPINMEDEMVELETIHKICMALKEKMIKEGDKKVNLVALGNIDMGYLRKCLEFVLKDTTCTVTVIINPERKNIKPRRPKAGTEKIIVKAEGKTYAELLKRVKNNVNIEQAGIDIKSIKRTQKGDLLLEVSDREKAIKLKETINRNLEDVKVIQKTNEITLHITDIDGDIEENELREEILKNNKDIGDNIQILALRQMRNGNKAATIKTERKFAEELQGKSG